MNAASERVLSRTQQMAGRVHAVVLSGLAIAGKGFAYVGVPPLFVSEIGLALMMVKAIPDFRIRALCRPITMLLLAFMAWSAWRTAPWIAIHGFDALRDAMLWGYGFIALAITVLAGSSRYSEAIMERLPTAARAYMLLLPIVLVSVIVFGSMIPSWPQPQVPILAPKPGDTLVILGIVVAAANLGLLGHLRWWWAIPMALCMGITATINRGGAVACLMAIMLSWLVSRRSAWPWLIAATAIALFAIVAITEMRISGAMAEHREVSIDQIVDNAKSLVGLGENKTSRDNAQWRLSWWETIIDYAIIGEYKWTGKGYGLNLADDDGFQVLDDDSLRSPHNATMNILARSGLPGLMLWAAFLVTWFVSAVRSWRRLRSHGELKTAKWLWLCICAVAATFANSCFDVYLEGPMGAWWFWSAIGLGMALMHRAGYVAAMAEPAVPVTASARVAYVG